MSLRFRRFWVTERSLAPLLLAGLAAALLAGVAIGPFPLSLRQIGAVLGGGGEVQATTVLWNIRLPRVFAAAMVGAALAAAGATYQTAFRNPLVSPDILGVSAGAGFGAVLGILLGLPVLMIQLTGFVTGLELITHIRQLDVNQIAQRILRMIGDADDGDIAFDAGPLVAGDIFQFRRRVAHGVGLRRNRPVR